MWGVEAAAIFLACSVSLIVLFTAPWWMRILTGVFGHVSTELREVDQQIDPGAVYPKADKQLEPGAVYPKEDK